MENNVAKDKGKVIPWETAPCRPDGVVSSMGQEESKEAGCKCANGECCVEGVTGAILPRRLKRTDN